MVVVRFHRDRSVTHAPEVERSELTDGCRGLGVCVLPGEQLENNACGRGKDKATGQ